jgi:5-methylcytosine-specific restriction endonuclease McrA
MPVRGKTAGNANQGSNWITRRRRIAIYDRDGWCCVWCTGEVFRPHGTAHRNTDATLDHLRPRSEEGAHETRNLITCCLGCNRLRGNMTASAFAMVIATKRQESFRVVRTRILRAIGKLVA